MFYGSMLSLTKYNFNSFQTSTRNTGVTKPPVASNRLCIWHFNDLHGNSDNIHGVMESARHFENSHQDVAHFTLSAGDNVSGGDLSKNEFILDVMQNIMSVDVSAVGNHEIDATSKGLDEFSKGKKIAFVATNVEFDNDNPLKNIIKKSVIKEQHGVKYGFIGTMPLDFLTCTKKSVQGDLEVEDYNDTIESLQEEINNLKQQGVNRIIMLSHVGYETDVKFAKDLDGVDIIVGGHSHTAVNGAKEGENVVKSKSGEPVVIAQAGENGKYYGVLDVEFGDDGVLTKISSQLNPVSTKKSPTVEYVKEQKMGHSPVLGRISEVEPLPENRRIKPHGWANLIVDSMRSEFDAEVAFLNAANVRKVPTEGKLTERDVSESVPMKNKLIRTKVTQKQVVDMLKQACKESLGGTTGEPGLMFVSGLTYKTTSNGELLEVNFIDKTGKINPIDINNPSETITYDAIYDEFTMRADGEYPHLAPKFEVQQFDYDKDITAINYIKKLQNKEKLVIVDDKRIEIVNTSNKKHQDNSLQTFLSLTAPKVS